MEEYKPYRLEKQELTKMTLRDLFYKYIRFLPLFLIFLALAVLGAWLYLRYSKEVYASQGTMLIRNNNENNREDKVDELISGKYKSQSIQNEIEVLKSKSLIERVINRLNLQFEYVAEGKIKNSDAYKTAPFFIEPLALNDSDVAFTLPVEFVNQSQFRVGGSSANYNFGQAFKNKNGIFRIVKRATPKSGTKFYVNYKPSYIRAGEFSSKINVQPKFPGTNTGIITTYCEVPNPYLAADIVNSLMREYQYSSVEQNNSTMDLTIGFVDQRLATVQRDIDSLKGLLVSFQQRNDVISPQTQVEQYLSSAGQKEDVLLGNRIALGNLNQIEGYLDSKNSKSGKLAVPSSLGIEDPTLNGMVEKYNNAQLERKALLDANIPEDNPKIKALDETIEVLRRSTLENVSNLKSSYQKTLGAASAVQSQNKAKASSMPAKVSVQMELERQLESKLALFKLLDGKREEASISRASTMANSKIIQMAEPNRLPVKPDRKMIRLAALLLGLLIPTGIVFIKELMNDKINTRNDIEKITEAPILGEIGHSYSEKTLVATQTNRSLVAEQFRILRSNLQYIIGKKEGAVIIVTSSFGGEGKSFVSTNMGSVLALTGKKVVVLEFDIRKPRVLTGLEMSHRSGITNYLVGNAQLDDLILPVDELPELYVLPCGPLPPNPAELLLDDKVEELFKKLKERFDYIIIDTAPVGMVSDALTLGKFADCTLYVTRQGHTYKKQVALIDEMYTTKKLPHLSVILNDIKMPAGGGYYGNYGYGYGYGYGEKNKNHYYQDEVRPKRTKTQKIISTLNPVNWLGKRK